MGWFSGKKNEAHRLLDKRTENGGLVFWVKDGSGAIDGSFVNELLQAHMENAPSYWLLAMSSAKAEVDRMSVKVHPGADGGCEVHVDISNLKKSASGGFEVS